jgi:dTDP-4-amino-4,6-dideoxygalactose transaminase
MTYIQAALGLAQLAKLETFIRRRRIIAGKYSRFLKEYGLKLPCADPGHIYFRYVVGLKSDSAVIIRRLQEKGIMSTRPVYKPLHRYLRQHGFINTDRVWRNSVSLPIYPGLTGAEAERVLTTFVKCLRGVDR